MKKWRAIIQKEEGLWLLHHGYDSETFNNLNHKVKEIILDDYENKIERLEKQIEEMKCCHNCLNMDTILEVCGVYDCKNEDKWEMKKWHTLQYLL